MLWGLLAIGVPIAIHLLLRRRPQVVDWGASRFLKIIIERRRAQLRVQSLTQLLTRILAITFLFLGAAHPQFEVGSESGQKADVTHHLYIVDVSMSMGAAENGVTRLNEAKRQILADLARSGEGDSWQILLHGTTEVPDRIRIPTYDVDAIQDEVSALVPGGQAGSLVQTLEYALANAEEFPVQNNEIIFWTDFSRREWEVTGSDAYELNERLNSLSNLASVAIVDVSGKQGGNLAVTELRANSPLARVNEKTKFVATVTNFSDDAVSTFVRLQTNGEPSAEKQIDVPADGDVSVPFEIEFTSPGPQSCTVIIQEDALAGDNIRQVALDVIGAVNVLILEESTSTAEAFRQSDFLQLALSASDRVLPNQETLHVNLVQGKPSSLATLNLQDYNVIFLCGATGLSELGVDQLREYVARGGGLLLSMDQSAVSGAMNALLASPERELVPVEFEERVSLESPTGSPFQIGEYVVDHPVLAPFQLRPESGLNTTRIYSYIKSRFRDSRASRRIVDLDSGDPLIIEHEIGLGRVFLVTTSFQPEWGSWVLWPSFLPMMSRSVDYLTNKDRSLLTSIVGHPVPEAVMPISQFDLFQLRNGGVVWDRQFGQSQLQDVFDTYLSQPGIYDLHSNAARKSLQTIVLSPDTQESHLQSTELNKLRTGAVLKDVPVTIVQDASMIDADRLTLRQADSSSMATSILFLAIVLLFIDQLFAYHWDLAAAAILGLLLSGFVVWLLAPSESTAVWIVIALVVVFVVGALVRGIWLRPMQNRGAFPHSGD